MPTTGSSPAAPVSRPMAPDYDPLRTVVERVGAEYPSTCHFIGYELEYWRPGTASAMVDIGLFVETTRATAALCTGCELACHKPVIVRTKPGADVASGFIVCDEEPDLGRIPVGTERLRRFRASLSTVARTVAVCLELDPSRVEAQRVRLVVGHIRGRYGPREVAVAPRDGRIVLTVGAQVKELTDLIVWTGRGAAIDRLETVRMANRKGQRPPTRLAFDKDRRTLQPLAKQAAFADRNQEILRHGKRLRAQGLSWPKAAEQIARMPFITSPKHGLRPIGAETVRRILAHMLATERIERA